MHSLPTFKVSSLADVNYLFSVGMLYNVYISSHFAKAELILPPESKSEPNLPVYSAKKFRKLTSVSFLSSASKYLFSVACFTFRTSQLRTNNLTSSFICFLTSKFNCIIFFV